MPMNASGVSTPPAGTYGSPGTTIESGKYNEALNDIHEVVTDHLARDGRKALTGNLPFGGNKATGLDVGTAHDDAPTLRQVQSGVVSQAVTVGGTVDAITITMAPATASWVTGERFSWVSSGANTSTTPTIAKDSLAAKTIKKANGVALVAGETGSSGYLCEGWFNGTDVILLNPYGSGLSASEFALTILDDADAATMRSTLGLGSAATLTAGTSANNVVQLDSSGLLPAVDGSQLTNIAGGGLKGIQRFTSSGTYTPTSGATKALVRVQGAGGGGKNNKGSGGGGAYCERLYTISGTGTVTVGTGGAGSFAAADGGSSSFVMGGVTITAGGGAAGGASAAGAGGTTSGSPDVSITGGIGGFGSASVVVGGGAGTMGGNGGNTSGTDGIDGLVVIYEF